MNLSSHLSSHLRIQFASLFLLSASAAYAVPPTVTITHSDGFDGFCSLFVTTGIQPEWKTELAALQPDFLAQWSALGVPLLQAAEEVTGQQFSKKEISARLSLCDVPPDSRFGYIVNMRHALKSFTLTPAPLRYEVNVLAHQILHEFLSEHPANNSALLKQYQAEPERVRNHLHVFALQKAALLKLGKSDVLAEVIRLDGQLPGGAYQRAWELVNLTDTEFERYIAELRR